MDHKQNVMNYLERRLVRKQDYHAVDIISVIDGVPLRVEDLLTLVAAPESAPRQSLFDVGYVAGVKAHKALVFDAIQTLKKFDAALDRLKGTQ